MEKGMREPFSFSLQVGAQGRGRMRVRLHAIVGVHACVQCRHVCSYVCAYVCTCVGMCPSACSVVMCMEHANLPAVLLQHHRPTGFTESQKMCIC
jgi:hypothetical protein